MAKTIHSSHSSVNWMQFICMQKLFFKNYNKLLPLTREQNSHEMVKSPYWGIPCGNVRWFNTGDMLYYLWPDFWKSALMSHWSTQNYTIQCVDSKEVYKTFKAFHRISGNSRQELQTVINEKLIRCSYSSLWSEIFKVSNVT